MTVTPIRFDKGAINMNRDWLKLRIPNLVYRIAQALEILVSLLVIAAILLSLVSVAHELGILASDPLRENGLHDFLAAAFTVVIGIEFLKMLSRHNMGSVVEVLLFAISRQMVIEHTSPVENLLMVAAIAALFLIRKFLFIPDLDDKQTLTIPHIDNPQQERAGAGK